MRGFNKILASSVNFNSATPAFSTSGAIGPTGTPTSAGIAYSTSIFGSQGSRGGPTEIKFCTGIELQANFGQGTPAAVFNLLGSNVLEKQLFSVIKTVTVGSTGAFLLNDSAPWYRYFDFQVVPSTAMSSTAVVTVVVNVQSNY